MTVWLGSVLSGQQAAFRGGNNHSKGSRYPSTNSAKSEFENFLIWGVYVESAAQEGPIVVLNITKLRSDGYYSGPGSGCV